IALKRNYRSPQPILDAANAVIARATEQIAKTLYSTKASAELPFLANVEDEAAQARYVADGVLDHREAGTALRRQAVLFRTAHHSDLLEIELGRRNIPFVKYGGLKFLGAAHVKDVLAVLRWAENPRDGVAAFRALQLLPGIGPATARAVLIQLSEEAFAAGALARFSPPAAATLLWPGLCRVIAHLRDANTPWQGQIGLVRDWYQPLMERLYDYPASRAGDPEQIDEERRLLYVAMTRAREHLHLVQPRRFYRIQQHRHGRSHVLAPRSRFLPDEILGLFTRVEGTPPSSTGDGHPAGPAPRVDISVRLREMWR